MLNFLIDRVRLAPDTSSTLRVRDFAIDVSITTADGAAFTTVLTAVATDNATLQDSNSRNQQKQNM